jgi:hypothetical protein
MADCTRGSDLMSADEWQLRYTARCYFYPMRDCPEWSQGGICGRIGQPIPYTQSHGWLESWLRARRIKRGYGDVASRVRAIPGQPLVTEGEHAEGAPPAQEGQREDGYAQ